MINNTFKISIDTENGLIEMPLNIEMVKTEYDDNMNTVRNTVNYELTTKDILTEKGSRLIKSNMLSDKIQNDMYIVDFNFENTDYKKVKKAIEDRFVKHKIYSLQFEDLAKEREKIAKEEAKKNSLPSIPVIDEFLQKWKERAFAYYKSLEKEYIALKQEEIVLTPEEIEGLAKFQIDNLKSHKRWEKERQWLKDNGMHGALIKNYIYDNLDKQLDKLLDKEVFAKKQHLIYQVQEKAGKILDASGLRLVGFEINGFIKGEKRTVEVRTIGAGGHNIQIYHYRTLII